MLWKGFQRPKRIEIDTDTLTDTYGRFTASRSNAASAPPWVTLCGRSLLSAIEGAAITAVRIEGALHEFSSLEGVVEDTTDIILNLKQVPLRSFDDTTRVITLDVSGPREVTAADFNGRPERRDPRPEEQGGDSERTGSAPPRGAGQERTRLRRRRQKSRRVDGNRLDPARLVHSR